METIAFKTNFKCSGCVEKVTPVLNEMVGKDQWKVDLQNPQRVLTVSLNRININGIIDVIDKAGFKAEKI